MKTALILMKFGTMTQLTMLNKMVLIKFSIFQVTSSFRPIWAQKMESAPILMKFGTQTKLIMLNNMLLIKFLIFQVT